jgi:hypothetical protein
MPNRAAPKVEKSDIFNSKRGDFTHLCLKNEPNILVLLRKAK